eukprot:CAMPEP_0204373654 /NCGR_PEP_ID=MMETSP0469-20131031/48194_1 /ASSEMBLY_ACC=CAM_ASM_000384 /TAXON_ID=2969 /ORGANISM="Oxyrrhis marina" /LENGTH=110 /DNA_ID=CAMNT_0051364165 /DNA_START=1 /DNA_END=333 /DNA_ORIENTATION=+
MSGKNGVPASTQLSAAQHGGGDAEEVGLFVRSMLLSAAYTKMEEESDGGSQDGTEDAMSVSAPRSGVSWRHSAAPPGAPFDFSCPPKVHLPGRPPASRRLQRKWILAFEH